MKVKIGDIATYICSTYPHPNDLSNARLTKLIYLADWGAARVAGHQLTSIEWIFNTYGPWVADVIDAVAADSRLEIVHEVTMYGTDKRLVRIKPGVNLNAATLLDDQTRTLVDAAIADTESMYFGEFIEHVYDTVPVRDSSRSAKLDLERLADPQRLRQPIDLAPIGITPTQYATMRDAFQREIARILLSMPVENVAVKVEVSSRLLLLPGLLIDSVEMDPTVEVASDSGGWLATARLQLKLSGEHPREEPLSESLRSSGYRVADQEWTKRYSLLTTSGSGTCTASVTRASSAFQVDVRSIRLE